MTSKQITLFILSLFLINIAYAQTEEVESGTLPDSFLWGVDLAFEKITELFSDNAKLKHSKERLAEVQSMIEKNKPDRAMKAKEKFNEIYNKLSDTKKVELKDDKTLIDSLGEKISAIASQKGKLNETSKAEIKELIKTHKETIQANKGRY